MALNDPATPRQKRAVHFTRKHYKSVVEPLLIKHGGDVERLTRGQASEILTAVDQFKDRGGEQQQEQHQREEREDNREQQREQQQDEDDEDEQKDEQKEQMNEQQRGFRVGSKQEYIAHALRANGMDVEATYAAIKDKIGQIPALTFTHQPDGRRVALPLGNEGDDSQQPTQHGRAIKTIYAVRNSLTRGGEGGEQKEKQQEQRHEQRHEQKQEKQEDKQNREAVEYLAWCRQLRKFCQDRDADGHPIDEIGLRPVEYGAAMLKGGIPLVAIKHAITMHYPPEARRALGVRDYDVQSFHTEERVDGIHAAAPYIDTLTECRDFDGHRLPSAMVGPKGTGKTTLSRQLAGMKKKRWDRDCPYGMVSMTSGTSPSAFNGRPRIADNGSMALIMALVAQIDVTDDDGEAKKFAAAAMKIAREAMKQGDVVISLWQQIYGGGGVWLFDEMDAADENLLLGVNSALANGYFANPATGKIIERHPDFIALAGMNTLGLGAGRDYKARNALDAATLDRWNAGRVQIVLDPRIEESMFWAIINR